MKNCLWLNNRTADAELPEVFTPACENCAFARDEYERLEGSVNCVFAFDLGVKRVTDWTDGTLPLTTPRYRLSASSPLVAAGAEAFVSDDRAYDLAHAPRCYEKGGDKGKVAIGCYQFAGALPLILIVK